MRGCIVKPIFFKTEARANDPKDRSTGTSSSGDLGPNPEFQVDHASALVQKSFRSSFKFVLNCHVAGPDSRQ